MAAMTMQQPAAAGAQAEFVEWLENSIYLFMEELCGINTGGGLNVESDPKLQASTLVLTNFTPISIPNHIAPIPQKWQKDQIIKNVVDDFGNDCSSDALLQGLNSTESSSEVTEASNADNQPPLPANTSSAKSLVSDVSSSIVETKEHNGRERQGAKRSNVKIATASKQSRSESLDSQLSQATTPHRSTSKSSLCETLMIVDASSSSASNNLSPTDAHSNNTTERQKSIQSPKDSNPQYEEFGNSFYVAAFERLQLPPDMPEQITRIQELARGPNRVQQLEKEKAAVKNELKNYDSQFYVKFGFLPRRDEKEPLRPLYMYYRRLKVAIQRGAKKKQQGSSASVSEPPPATRSKVDEELAADEKKLVKLQQTKIQLRNELQKFQENFVKREKRVIKFHADIVPIENEYKQYKNIKEHIKKLDEAIKRKKAFSQLSNPQRARHNK